MRMPSGAELFARYAYPPNELGYCGPTDSTLLERAVEAGDGSEAELARRARDFDGAWPYLEVLAAAGGGLAPLDPLVVEAYWVGNGLLDRVDPAAFDADVRRTFAGQTSGRWRTLELADAEVPPLAHHSFHVLEVYPWVGLLRTGHPAAPMVLDRCRIRWGEVVSVDGEHTLVEARLQRWDGTQLRLGQPVRERVRWASQGRSWLPDLSAGQQVSLHWDWVCDVLSREAVDQLETRSASQLARTNRWLITENARTG